MSDDRPILVTGASGFLAAHVVQQLQQLGFRVRGTVRSTQNDQKVKPLMDLCPDAPHPLELFEADLTDPKSWTKAVAGCQVVIHTASPVPVSNPKHESDVITPAVEGTLSILRASREAGGIRRIVLTSSLIAVTPANVSGSFDESTWTDLSSTNLAYYKSKTMAEKAAWDYVADLPEDEKFQLAVINPGYITGPVLSGGYATSMEIPKRLLMGQVPALPRIILPVIDVRDVATAHVTAMTLPEAAGNRHIVVSGNLWMEEIAAIYRDEFKELGYRIPKHVAPLMLVKLMALFDRTVKLVLPIWGKVATFDTSRMRNVLNIRPREPKQSLLDMAYSMIDRGIVTKTKKFRKMENDITRNTGNVHLK